MDVLVSLGTNAAYIYSALSILHHHFARHHISGDYVPTDFFETSAMLITFILLGKYLEVSLCGPLLLRCSCLAVCFTVPF